MTSGFDVRIQVFRETHLPDDEVGGAVTTGVIVYETLRASFSESTPSELLIQQGVEIRKTASILVHSPTQLLIYEEDEVKVTFPAHHPYLGQLFKVIDVTTPQIPRMRRNNHYQLTCQRMDYNRTEQ